MRVEQLSSNAQRYDIYVVIARSALYVRTPQVKSPKSVLLSSPPDYNRFLRVAYGGVDTLSAPR